MQRDEEIKYLYLTKRYTVIVLLILSVALITSAFIALSVGSEYIPIKKIYEALFSATHTETQFIILDLRIPRIALAIFVGAALAMAGAAFQSLLRNPLADPYVLGVSGGAALGSILAIMFVSNLIISRPLFGFIGALISSLIVYKLGKRYDDPARLVLAGIVISTLLSSVIVLLLALADNIKLRNITHWLLGDLSNGNKEGLIILGIAVFIGLVILFINARALNLMMIGERDAFALGAETKKVRRIVYITASLLTGTAVSVGGAVGYVGLVVPHIVRLAVGTDNRIVIPTSALVGALLVLFADTIARTAIAPRELPAGAILALIGAPVFIYLLLYKS